MAATVAAANLTLTYLLFAAEHPGISIAAYVPFVAIGSAPFLLTAGLLAWGARGGAHDASRKAIGYTWKAFTLEGTTMTDWRKSKLDGWVIWSELATALAFLDRVISRAIKNRLPSPGEPVRRDRELPAVRVQAAVPLM